VLVVQVEDGTQTTLTRTDLSKAVDVLEKVYGHFGEGELAHCFQEEHDITAGGYNIRKIDASKIQGDTAVRVVFFKMALTTGWDCPRAEVMMSFRRAADPLPLSWLTDGAYPAGPSSKKWFWKCGSVLFITMKAD
jgi:type III restriction enzyme